MAKKDDGNVLALPPMKTEFGVTANTSLAPNTGRRPLNKRERQIIELSIEQRTVMEHTSANARLGMVLIGQIHEQASQTFEETTAFIIDTKNQPGRNAEHQAYIDQFSLSQIQLSAQEFLGIINVTATGIGMEVHRSLYPEPEVIIKEVKSPGFFGRILGKT